VDNFHKGWTCLGSELLTAAHVHGTNILEKLQSQLNLSLRRTTVLYVLTLTKEAREGVVTNPNHKFHKAPDELSGRDISRVVFFGLIWERVTTNNVPHMTLAAADLACARTWWLSIKS
jgi:hypothetical protein